VVNTPEERLPICQIQLQEVDEEIHYTVTGPGGEMLGTVAPAGRGRWNILDANGVAGGQVRERNGWRHSFLFDLISPSALESLLAAAFRMRYEVELNGLRALQLRELDSEFKKHQAYRLRKFTDLSDRDELLLLAGLWAALWSVC
jgi:hypothetical protein